MKRFSTLIFTALMLQACGTNSIQESDVNALVGSDNAQQICEDAGINYLPNAEKYSLYVGKSGNYPVYASAAALFAFDAPFSNQPRATVDARAAFWEQIVFQPGKSVNLRFTGGIANLKHTTEEFRFYMGYLKDGQAKYVEMDWHQSPTTTYTAYTKDWMVPDLDQVTTEVWFEARYKKDGQRKTSYESNNGQNFEVTIVNNATKSLCFTKDGRQAVSGALMSGDSVDVVYDVGRLMQRMYGTRYADWPAWSVYIHYAIRNNRGEVVKQGKLPAFATATNPRTGSSSTVKPSFKPTLRIPNDVAGGNLQLWFEGPNRGPTVWDSDYGLNFTLGIGN